MHDPEQAMQSAAKLKEERARIRAAFKEREQLRVLQVAREKAEAAQLRKTRRGRRKHRAENAEDDSCPLCLEPFDITDKSFRPCKCEYQVCMFCYNKLTACPACRKPYRQSSTSGGVKDDNQDSPAAAGGGGFAGLLGSDESSSESESESDSEDEANGGEQAQGGDRERDDDESSISSVELDFSEGQSKSTRAPTEEESEEAALAQAIAQAEAEKKAAREAAAQAAAEAEARMAAEVVELEALRAAQANVEGCAPADDPD